MNLTKLKKAKTIIDDIREWEIKDKKNIALQMFRPSHLEKYTYDELYNLILSTAKRFEELNLKPGARVILLGPNSPMWVVAALSIIKCECTSVLLDSSLDLVDLNKLIYRSDPQLILTTKQFHHEIDPVIQKVIPTLDIENSFKFFNHSHEGNLKCPVPTKDSDPETLCIIYTSGTTGNYKGVMILHDSIWCAISGAGERAKVSHNDQMLVVLPASNVYGFLHTILAPLSLGSTVTLVDSYYPDDIMRTMKKLKPTIMLCAPRMVEFTYGTIKKILARQSLTKQRVVKALLWICGWVREKTGYNLGRRIFRRMHEIFGDSIETYVCGGEQLNPKTHRELRAMGFTIMESYGLTETSSLVSCSELDKHKVGSVGKILKDIELMIYHPNTRGEGEICICGPNVMKGYFRDPEATKDALRGTWLYTGDLGRVDEDGYLYITGRCDEIITAFNGESVNPKHVEELYEGIPYVKDLAVTGIRSNPRYVGEEIHAAIILSREVKDKEEMKQKVKKEIASRSRKLNPEDRIKHIHFVDIIPKTTTFEVRRNLLKKQLEND